MYAHEVVEKAAADPVFAEKLKSDPIQTLKELPEALRTDVWVYRGIILALGFVAAGGLLLVAALVLTDHDAIPEIFTAAISAAIGAMAGLLVPSPRPAK